MLLVWTRGQNSSGPEVKFISNPSPTYTARTLHLVLTKDQVSLEPKFGPDVSAFSYVFTKCVGHGLPRMTRSVSVLASIF